MTTPFEVEIPGDKSITQRALILSALAHGTSRLAGVLPSADPIATAGALRSLGAEIPPLSGAELHIRGVGSGGLRPADAPLDFQNSGTGARLMMGVLAGLGIEAVFTGDASLRSRPMRRITEPLRLMGAGFEELGPPDRLPIRLMPAPMRTIEYRSPVASAQVKSAVLLAGMAARIPVSVHEPGRSRDHTERMLSALGCTVDLHPDSEGRGRVISLRSTPAELGPLDVDVPGDFSSAAFFLVLGALLDPNLSLVLRDVGLNPTRTGLLPVLERMGARVARSEERIVAGEPVGTLEVAAAELTATEVAPEEVPALIDEIPILAIAASRARGTTRITGAGELRVKETDRLAALESNLRAVGVTAEATEEGLVIEGSDRPLTGTVDSEHDHRIAMAFGVLGALPGNSIDVRGAECVAVSFPRFWEALRSIGHAGAGERPRSSSEPDAIVSETRIPGLVITIDGPAGSGKSTTAKAVARRLGYRHLNSGHLYRGLTFVLLDRDVPTERWSGMSTEDFEALGLRIEPGNGGFDLRYEGGVLRGELVSSDVTGRVSEVSALPAVREWALERQRSAATFGGLVTDGRDMGTTVFPNAELKIFLIADPTERARRRLIQNGLDASALTDREVEEERDRIEVRDRQDSERSVSPLRPAEDAVVLDTTRLSFEEQVDEILARHGEVSARRTP